MSKVTSRGQITIPQKLREEEGITEDDYVVIKKVGHQLVISKRDQELDDITRKFQTEAKERGITKKELLKELESIRKARYEKWKGPHGRIH